MSNGVMWYNPVGEPVMLPKNGVATKTLLTCDEFERLAPSFGKSELIDGEVVELAPAGQPQGHSVSRVVSLIFNFVESRNLGWVMSNETGILMKH